MPIVYLIVHKDTGKVYVGKTVKTRANRWQCHLSDARRGSGKYLHRAIRAHSEDRFDICVIDSADTERDCLDLEKHYIRAYGSTDPAIGYNLTFGGEGVQPNAETRRRMSEGTRRSLAEGRGAIGQIGVKLDPEMVERRAAKIRGRVRSEEHKANLSAAKKAGGKVSTPKGYRVRKDVPDAEIADLYRRGESCAEIAARYGTSRSTISWRLRQLGVQMRPVGFQRNTQTDTVCD